MKFNFVLLFFIIYSFGASFSNKPIVKKIDEFSLLQKRADIQKILREDEFYKEAKLLLNNTKKYIKKNIKDIENGRKIIKSSLPNYQKAIEYLVKSCKKYKNPIAAYQGYKLIISTYFLDKKYRKYLPLFAQVMYDYKTCTGYLALGDILNKGIYHKVNKTKALQIYQNGIPICKKQGKIWEYEAIRISAYKTKKKLLSKKNKESK